MTPTDIVMLPYVTQYPEAMDYLRARGLIGGLAESLAQRYDLRYDERERRIVFPVLAGDCVIGGMARSIDPRERVRWRDHPVDGVRWSVLFDGRRATGGDTLIVVEGAMDCLMLAAAAADRTDIHIVALGGSHPTAAQIEQIATLAPRYRMIYLLLDRDAWGRARLLADGLRQATGRANIGAACTGIPATDPAESSLAQLRLLLAYLVVATSSEVRGHMIQPPTRSE